ncbi:hypothetical protein D3C76_1039040 [compost metagenome]
MLIFNGMLPRHHRDVPKVFLGGAGLVHITLCIHRKPLTRRHVTVWCTILLGAGHFELAFESAQAFARATIQRAVHQHGITRTGLHGGDGLSHHQRHQIAATKHIERNAQTRQPQIVGNFSGRRRIAIRKRDDAIHFVHGHAGIGQCLTTGIDCQRGGGPARIAGISGASNADNDCFGHEKAS